MECLTKEVKSKWLEKMRDPTITKAKRVYFEHSKCMCAIGCLLYVLDGKCTTGHTFEAMRILDEMSLTRYEGRTVFSVIATMNDETDMTLPQIADFIEKNILAEGE